MIPNTGSQSWAEARPVIATVIGDPAGVGPEVCVKAFATGLTHECSRSLLIGSVAAVRDAIAYCGLALKARAIDDVGDAGFASDTIDVLDLRNLAPGDYVLGQASAASGHAVRSWLDFATALAEQRKVAGWIMAPVDRTSLKLATGLNDYDDIGPSGTYLFRINGNLRIVPISENTPISEVPATVTGARIREVMDLLNSTLLDWGFERPRIAVAGLNPHSRGIEEEHVIKPAIAAANAAGMQVAGPVSPDAVFRQCLEGKYDAVLSMYHDQGQIALKTGNFEGACSIYLGLPYLHLTVPHGSAFDIAGKGIAQHHSMVNAMRTAGLLAAGRYARAR
jgi:4-hydroxy-L-threonine phosphate dehydrogenase PdxA